MPSILPTTNAPPDWSATQLGDQAGWPPELRLTVDILLNCPAPMLLVWGGARVLIYNEAYAALAGPGHAHPPGGTVPAVWPAPLAAAPEAYEQALRGAAVRLARCSVALAEPADYELCFTPIRSAGGAVGGVLCALAPCPRAAPAQAGGALRILVVEDNLDSQYLVCEMLKAFGHQPEGVARAEDALPRLAAARFDVLFSDVSLPGISGVELARQALAAQPALKVIFASGYGDALLRHVDFPHVSLQKPYDLDQLQTTLAAIAGQLDGAPQSAPNVCN